jgi:hypothetical protein
MHIISEVNHCNYCGRDVREMEYSTELHIIWPFGRNPEKERHVLRMRYHVEDTGRGQWVRVSSTTIGDDDVAGLPCDWVWDILPYGQQRAWDRAMLAAWNAAKNYVVKMGVA